MIDFLLSLFVCLYVSQSVSPLLPLVRFGQLLGCADKRIVNTFCEATDSPTERIAGSFEHKPLRLRF